MSKPPSKSGGNRSGGPRSNGSGRPPRGPSSGSRSTGGPRIRGPRDDAFIDDRPKGGRGGERGAERGAPRGAGARGTGPRTERSRDGAPRDGASRSAAPRGDRPYGDRQRDGGPRTSRPYGDRPRDDRAGTERPRSDRPRSERPYGDRPRDDRPRAEPRAERSRDAAPREGSYRRGPAREDAPRGERQGERRDGAYRGSYGSGSGASSGGGYSRPRDDRYNTDDRRGGFGSRGGSYGSSRGDSRPAPTARSRPGPAPRAAAPTPKDPSLPEREGDRIAKLLARAGVASRREVERMIIEGRVKLDDQLIETPSTVLTSLRGVTVDDVPVAAPEGTRLFLFHKPSGLLTAERDPAGRPTIYTALRNALPEGAGRVMPVGRLDLNTEGLLLLTNDGEFKRQLELPSTGVPRTYRARTFGDITQGQLEDLMEGIEVDGVIYGKIDANMERRTGRNQWIEMTLTEGKNREVRRVLEALGLQVSRLLRTAYGPFRLGDLPKGMAGEVSQRDLENFRRTLPASKGPASKEPGDKEA